MKSAPFLAGFCAVLGAAALLARADNAAPVNLKSTTPMQAPAPILAPVAPAGRHWATPGGGLNPGESYAAAASRELTEETGWDDVALLGELHRSERILQHGDRAVRQHERHFLARTDQARRELGNVAEMHVSDGIVAWRWWTLAELDATAEVIFPAGLAGLIRGVLGR